MKTSMELYRQVRDFRPEDILSYYAEHEDISLSEAKERWDEMLKFLVLCVTSDKVHAPSERIDPAWHAFIMHTERYEEFCLHHLGRFVHHRPKPMPIAEFQNSLREILSAFPDSVARPHLWRSVLNADCSGGSDCVAQCAEKGCSRVIGERVVALPSVVALSAA